MRRLPVSRPQFLVALLVVVVAALATPTVATALAATGDLDVAGNETVSPLRLSRATVGPEARLSATADLSSALAADEERLATALGTDRFEHAFQAAPETQERLAVVEKAVDRVASRAERLQAERTAAVRAFERGKISATELFLELGRIDAAARGIADRIDRIGAVVENRSDMSLPSDLSVRLTSVEASLVSLDGPVTKQVAAASHGQSATQPVYVQTSDDGIALAVLDGGELIRETTVWSARATSGQDQFAAGNATPPVAAYARAEELYPWASSNRVANPSIEGIGDTPIYVVGLNHRHGRLTAYLDGRTTDAFYEIQRLQLSRLPTTTLVSNRSGAVSLSVRGTFDGGPMLVSVTDGAGDPVRATVSLDNATVGSTDGDGHRWLMDTAGRTTVTAETGEGSVTVTVDDPS